MNSTRAMTILELMSLRGLDNEKEGALMLSNQVEIYFQNKIFICISTTKVNINVLFINKKQLKTLKFLKT